jgi:alkylation response protein AidB-like acyl-CoA dehydrogenase
MSRRDELIAMIREQAEVLADGGNRSEEMRTLPADTVSVLREMGVFWAKTPAELGGEPLTPLEFCDVIEELAYVDGSVAWAAMIGAGCNGLAGGWLPAAEKVFRAGRPLPVVAGQLSPRGTGTPVEGGYIVTGHWRFSSGLRHSSWLIGAFKPQSLTSGRDCPAPPDSAIVVFAIPRDHAEIIDNWHVAGLAGTGSLDWRVDGAFVPEEMTYELGTPAARGGDLFRLGMPTFVSNEVPPWCVGVARRALDDIAEISLHTDRFPGGPTVSERAVFHKELGRAATRVRAARLLHRDAMATAWTCATGGLEPPEDVSVEVNVASVFAVETCADVVSDLFRYGGGRVLSLASPMQRHLRDLLAARQHLAVSEESYETAGRLILNSRPHPAPTPR